MILCGYIKFYSLICKVRLRGVCVLATLFAATNSHSIELTSYMEVQLVKNVSTNWQTVSLANSYSDAIVVCTYTLAAFNAANPPAITRIRNITSSSFDLRIQGWEDSAAATNDVHCIIVDEGAHTLPDGRQLEAHSVLSDQTNGRFATDGNWNQALTENVSTSIVNTYANPVVLGQVMSFNDNRASAIYLSDCDNRGNHPFQSGMADGICVGKHVGSIATSRNPETIGYIVAESGSGTVNNVFYELALGADAIGGASNAGDNYGLNSDHTVAVLTQAGEDGGDGSWAVHFGNGDTLPANQITLQVDEEVVEGDTGRNHTDERVYYWAFAAAELTLQKTVINDALGVALPVDFTLTATGIDTISGANTDPGITDQPVHPGTYVLSEANLPGYIASAWTCVGATVTGGNTITVASGDNAVCTIVNDDIDLARLTLEKQVANDAGGTATAADFVLSFADGVGISGTGVTGASQVTSVDLTPGTYTLSETPVSGYRLAAISCDGSDADGLDGLQIASGEIVTCTFLNEDAGVDLEIVKLVDDESPNVGDVLTFTLKISNNGPDTATNVQVTDIVPAGFSYVPASIAGGSTNNDVNPGGTGLVWTLATLSPGAESVLTFKAEVNTP